MTAARHLEDLPAVFLIIHRKQWISILKMNEGKLTLFFYVPACRQQNANGLAADINSPFTDIDERLLTFSSLLLHEKYSAARTC